jgi:23S rRNA (cytosine1962-C5)-methyltransferase
MALVYIQPGHVQPIWAGHPWVFSRAIKRIEGYCAPGDAVDVIDPSGKFLGRGFISPDSAIAVRILTRHEGESLDAEFLSRRPWRCAGTSSVSPRSRRPATGS